MDLKKYLMEKRAIVDEALRKAFPEPEGPASDVIRAMNYSLFAGGKRLRPILCLAGSDAVGGDPSDSLPVACALELIHTYSLIHDDLPLMDDDSVRRGKPTNHKVFGEAVALLAGDGLLTEAFRLMASERPSERVPQGTLLEVIDLVAKASGYQGMVGGQVVDIQSEGKTVDFETVEFIHRHKTGALIHASICSGALLGGADGPRLEALSTYGLKIGLAFQISDDILDVEGDSETMGKGVGGDGRKGKATYPALLGLAKSKEIQESLVDSAVEALRDFDRRSDPLRQIARYIIERKK
jgi:geranylgeranyl diphosphate synthase, type II